MRTICRLIVVVAFALLLSGCHALLLFPCLLNCSTWVKSLPPRSDPIARALARGSDVNTLDAAMTTAVRTQLTGAGPQSQQPPDCAQTPAIGCRYSVLVKVDRQIVLQTEPRGCGMMDVVIVGGAEGAEARRSGFREVSCPAEPPRPAFPLPLPEE